MRMNSLFPVISIVVATVLMILAMHLRTKSREKTYSLAVDFFHEHQSWRLTVIKARFACILLASIKVVPKGHSVFLPIYSASISKNGKKILSLPNFWTYHMGAALCFAKRTDRFQMDVELSLRTPAMAQSFTQALVAAGIHQKDFRQDQNVVTFVCCPFAPLFHPQDNPRE